MNNKILLEVEKMQIEYKKLLLSVYSDTMANDDICAALDSIIVFWKKKSKLVNCYETYYLPYIKTYVYTGACFLDNEDSRYYSFMLLGKNHVFDDPLTSYAKVVNKTDNKCLIETFSPIITSLIKYNISIITNQGKEIIILPIRGLEENTEIYEQANILFCNFFKHPIKDINQYFNDKKSINDIVNSLRTDIKSQLLLDEDDDLNDSLENNYIRAISKRKNIFSNELTDAQCFYRLIIGYILQAFDILFSCIGRGLIPFMVTKITVHYVGLISSMINDKSTRDIVTKSIIAWIIYNRIDAGKVGKVSFKDFCDKRDKSKFDDKLENELIKNNIYVNSLDIKTVMPIIDRELSNLYGYL